jgi:hypothetical protein
MGTYPQIKIKYGYKANQANGKSLRGALVEAAANGMPLGLKNTKC